MATGTGDLATWVSAIATFGATCAALYIASRQERSNKTIREIRGKALAGELLMGLSENSKCVMTILAAWVGLDNIGPVAASNRAAQALKELNIDALQRAVDRAELLDREVAEWAGFLLGYFRIMKNEAEKIYEATPENAALLLDGIGQLAFDTVGRITRIFGALANAVNFPHGNIVGDQFEKLRMRFVEVQQRRNQNSSPDLKRPPHEKDKT